MNSTNNEPLHDDQAPNPERRKFLGGLVGLINAVVVLVVLAPTVGLITAPLRDRNRKGRWVPVMDDDLAMGETREATVELEVKDGYRVTTRQYVVYIHRNRNGLLCFDPACTHLGCRIRFQEEKDRYFCPCHGGVFDSEGKVVSGPPPKPLSRHEVKSEGGKIYVFMKV
ncbi:MAG: ubiquinol-cytochrome c reductase iron-sulfur subunit [Armatimonadota bacterium]